MSAALKIAIIVTALCVLSNAETKVSNEKEKRGSDKEPAALQVIQQQQKPQAISQQTYQLVYPQATTKLSPSASSQYSPQQLQYIFQQAVLPQLQKQAVPSPLLPQQYVIPQQQHQFQYIPVHHQQPLQPQQKGAAPVADHAAQQQAYLGGQYYLHPSQLAGALGSQYHHPGAAPYYFVPQHQAQQFYLPQGHHAAATTANPAFYFGGGFQGNYNPFLGNQQFYYPQHHPQQILNQNVKGASGVEARGKGSSYVLPPYDGIHQLQQYSTLPDSLVEGNAGVKTGSVVAQSQQPRESPALTLSGKYGSKTSSERQQG